jgi:hypothetical protein
MAEYQPWETPNQKIEDALPKRNTIDLEKGMGALRAVREKMGGVLKKDQALKVSTYVTPTTDHKEGDVWEENDKKWTIKHGIKQTISKLAGARKPFFCPQCERILRGKADDRMWILHGKCHRCVIEGETTMRLAGTWEAYERSRMLANAIAMAKDVIQEFTAYKDAIGNPEIHFADGRIETWKIDSSQIKQDIQTYIEQIEEWLKELLNEQQNTQHLD